MILTTVYKKPRNFVEIDPGKPGNLRQFFVGNWVDTLMREYPTKILICDRYRVEQRLTGYLFRVYIFITDILHGNDNVV